MTSISGAKPCFLSNLRMSFAAAFVSRRRCNKEIENLALVVDRPPEPESFAGDQVRRRGITRGTRFFGEATLLYFFGAKVKEILDKYLEVALIVFLVLVVGGVFLARYVFGATLS